MEEKAFAAPQELVNRIDKLADSDFDGSFSAAVRHATQIGLDVIEHSDNPREFTRELERLREENEELRMDRDAWRSQAQNLLSNE